MVLDASAVIAILNREAGYERFAAVLDEARGQSLISPTGIYEAATGLARARIGKAERKVTPAEIKLAHAAVRAFIEANDVRQVDINEDTGRHAIDAAARYGRTVGHPADLNFGDCFAYACAKAHHTGLLYKGNDFAQTDLAETSR